MIPTFSVNINIYNPVVAKRILEIANSLDTNKQVMMEWASEAFLKAAEGGCVGNVNLQKYSEACNRNEQLSKLSKTKKETSLLTQDEINDGHIGELEQLASYTDKNLENTLSDMDMGSYINMFLDKREELFLKKGIDIWRLIQLVKLEDKQAQNKLRVVMEEYNLTDMLYYILTKPACKNKLEAKLCSHSQ